MLYLGLTKIGRFVPSVVPSIHHQSDPDDELQTRATRIRLSISDPKRVHHLVFNIIYQEPHHWHMSSCSQGACQQAFDTE
jgi:fatty acid desaturase